MNDKNEFAAQLVEMYQGEVIGEVLLNAMLRQYTTPDQQLKSATMFQLETETKARLRPAMIALGVDITEEEASREAGAEFFAAVSGEDWQGAMAVLRDGIEPYVNRYREIAQGAPAQYKDLALSMVEHEESLYEFVKNEAVGDGEQAMQRMETASAPIASAFATSAPERIPPDTTSCTLRCISNSTSASTAWRNAGKVGMPTCSMKTS